jgi:hypothetical protein
MWEPQPLTTLRASKACRGENFTFFTYLFRYYQYSFYLYNIGGLSGIFPSANKQPHVFEWFKRANIQINNPPYAAAIFTRNFSNNPLFYNMNWQNIHLLPLRRN